MANKSVGFHGRIFDMSAQPTKATPAMATSQYADANNVPTGYDPLVGPDDKSKKKGINPDELEGAQDDPMVTKVVDRRWYDRNKHLFPASLWEEFDPAKDYTSGIRTDAQGNSFFRSS